MNQIVLIVAAAENGVIGKDGAIPWRLPEDLRRFKALTMGHPVVMGRKTWDSLPKKPLPGRSNIIVTRDAGWRPAHPPATEKVVLEILPEKALEIALRENDTVYVIGGAEIYRALLPRATRIELTEIHMAIEGDAHFPVLDKNLWRETAREDRVAADGLGYSFVTLEHKS